jgi:hypothetical protein
MQWNDETRRGEVVSSVAGVPALVRITIHRHIDYPGKWLVSLVPSIVNNRVLEASSIREAKTEGLGIAQRRLEDMLGALVDLDFENV